MKKIMFILVVAATLVACGGNASTEAVSADSTTATVDTTAVVADTTAVTDSAK